MKINKVTIENFRNYIGKHEFDVNKRITVLHGDNGFGKSTFFDAIEWCLTNSISRFSSNETDMSKVESFKNDIVTQYASRENIDCRVSIEIGDRILTREFKVNSGEFGNTQAKVTNLNGKLLLDEDNKEINTIERVENFLKSGLTSTATLGNKTSIGQLFKQTYILSQEKVTEFISSDNPEKRFRSLANIMGFQPMLNLADNTKKIIKELEKEYKQVQNNLDLANNSIKSKEETKANVDVFDLSSILRELNLSLNNEYLSNQLDDFHTSLLEKRIKLEKLIEIYSKNNGEYSNIFELKSKINNCKTELSECKNRKKYAEKLLDKVINKSEELHNEKMHHQQLSDLRIQLQKIEQNLVELGFQNDYERLNRTVERYRNRISQLEYYFSIIKDIQRIDNDRKDIPLYIENLKTKIRLANSRLTRNKMLISSISEKLVNRDDNVIANLLNSVSAVYDHLNKHHSDGYCPVCSSFVGEGLDDSVKSNITILSEKMNDKARYAEKLLKAKNKIELKNQNLIFEITKYENEIKLAEKKLNGNKKHYAEIQDNVYFNEEVLTLSLPEIIDYLDKNKARLASLEKALSYVITHRNLAGRHNNLGKLDHSGLSLEQISKSVTNFDKAKVRLNHFIINTEEKIVGLQKNIRKLEKDLEEFNSNIDEKYMESNLQEIYKMLEDDIASVKKNINLILNAKNALKDIASNEVINQQIIELREEKLHFTKKLKGIYSAINSLEVFVKDIKSVFGEEAQEYLNKPTSPIQKYYKYLDPLPSTNLLKFISKEEKLWIKVAFENNVHENGQLATARNILSSGQLNVLAISIFLAVNEAQKVHPLDFVAIDDPIQNMDDVNQFSICDILGGIKKQLIFSTHDLDFLKLFIKKNEHIKHDIQIINLKSPYLEKSKVEYISLS